MTAEHNPTLLALPSECGCGCCPECANARTLYDTLGRGWDSWAEDHIRGALAALLLLGYPVHEMEND